MPKEKITITIDADLLKWLRRNAVLRGRSLSNFINWLIRQSRERKGG